MRFMSKPQPDREHFSPPVDSQDFIFGAPVVGEHPVVNVADRRTPTRISRNVLFGSTATITSRPAIGTRRRSREKSLRSRWRNSGKSFASLGVRLYVLPPSAVGHSAYGTHWRRNPIGGPLLRPAGARAPQLREPVSSNNCL